jgi:crotonobetainyl-CoA:carnitine CoA-transferase CaiB-like acyl-CoA transferase
VLGPPKWCIRRKRGPRSRRRAKISSKIQFPEEFDMSALPLSGIKILDLTRVLAGPLSAQMLGDLGAEVIKIERPVVGDDTRTWGPPFLKDAEGKETRDSSYFLCANRGKQSVTLDIATPEA